MHPRTTRAALFSLCLALASSKALAVSGLASGKLGLLESNGIGYGYSSYTGLWTQTNLDGPVLNRLAGEFLGYLRTTGKVNSYNPTADRWVKYTYTGQPLIEDVEGNTAVCVTSRAAYANATVWTVWRAITFPKTEFVVGGGSAGPFALAWTSAAAYAYNASQGQWTSSPLPSVALGGIATGGLGLVWTSSECVAFDPDPGSWTSLDLGAPGGISATGSGHVGLVWGDHRAFAFSQLTDSWNPLDTAAPILAGSASGDIALLWTTGEAWAFNANTGTWTPILITVPLGVPDPTGSTLDAVLRSENPSRERRVVLHWSGDAGFDARLFDASGAQVARATAAETLPGEWEAVLDARSIGHPLPSGTYWALAEGAGRVEGRRVVFLP